VRPRSRSIRPDITDYNRHQNGGQGGVGTFSVAIAGRLLSRVQMGKVYVPPTGQSIGLSMSELGHVLPERARPAQADWPTIEADVTRSAGRLPELQLNMTPPGRFGGSIGRPRDARRRPSLQESSCLSVNPTMATRWRGLNRGKRPYGSL